MSEDLTIAPLLSFFLGEKTLTGNNPKLDLVNVDARKKIGKIMTIRSQDNERKRNSDVNQGPLLRQNFAKNDGPQFQSRSCQC